MVISQVVNSVFNSCSYVLTQDGATWIVDCGDIEQIIPLVKGQVCGVLLTHAHFDHIYGLNSLLDRFPDALIYTNEDGKRGLADDKWNFSRYHEEPFVLARPECVRVVPNGTSVRLFDQVSAQAVYTPGHSPCCVSWLVDNALFTGDSYIPGVRVVTNFPHSDKWLAAQSLQTIAQLLQGRQVCPGHPSQSVNGSELI
jgi:glyoxylase-like metal-dependent hydrolase (beta-lactamase superfamily II)